MQFSRKYLIYAVLVIGLVVGATIAVSTQTNIFVRPPVAGSLQRRATLEGQVFDRHSNRPVAGAHVQGAGHADFATTDAEGRFILPVSRPIESISAWKEGFFIGSALAADSRSILLTKLPDVDNEKYEWKAPNHDKGDAESCGSCHPAIYREWSSSSHAISVARPHFLEMYAGTDRSGRANVGWSLVKDRPEGMGVCAACHAPTLEPNAQSGYDIRSALLDPKTPGSKRTESEPGTSGVHCDYCHKIVGPAGGEVGKTHGRFGLKLLRPAEGQLSFGPLKDSTRSDNSYSAFQKDSRLCASCHEGTVFGVHVYSTYSEWQASPAGKKGVHCQDCHMIPAGTITNLAPGRGGAERNPTTLSNHLFYAGSGAQMLYRCLDVSLLPKRQGAGVSVKLEIRPHDVGHKVPTGFSDRNIVVTVEALDAEHKSLAPLAGPTLPALAGKADHGKAGRLYAKILRDAQGQSPAPFWRAVPEMSDTRLASGQIDATEWTFPSTTKTVFLRIVHRQFWADVAEEKGWPDNETVIIEYVEPVRE